jgi:hypothetical protein
MDLKEGNNNFDKCIHICTNEDHRAYGVQFCRRIKCEWQIPVMAKVHLVFGQAS